MRGVKELIESVKYSFKDCQFYSSVCTFSGTECKCGGKLYSTKQFGDFCLQYLFPEDVLTRIKNMREKESKKSEEYL